MAVIDNEIVVYAQLSDETFFYHENLKNPLVDYMGNLDDMVFQEEFGAMCTKVGCVIELASRSRTTTGERIP